MSRKTIKQEDGTFLVEEEIGIISESDAVELYAEQYKKNHKEYVRVETSFDSWSDTYSLIGYRQETTCELQKRKARESKQREAAKKRRAEKEAKDYELYKKLKARFVDGS